MTRPFFTLSFPRLFRSTLTNGHKLFPQGSGKRWFCEEFYTSHTTHCEVLPVPGDATLKNHSGKTWFCEQAHTPHTTHHAPRGVASVWGRDLEKSQPRGKRCVPSPTFLLYVGGEGGRGSQAILVI